MAVVLAKGWTGLADLEIDRTAVLVTFEWTHGTHSVILLRCCRSQDFMALHGRLGWRLARPCCPLESTAHVETRYVPQRSSLLFRIGVIPVPPCIVVLAIDRKVSGRIRPRHIPTSALL